MRERPQDPIDLTPWSRKEYEFCLEPADSDSAVELARKLFFRLNMSLSGQFTTGRSSWRRSTCGKRLFNPEQRRENLIAASQRLLPVQLENRDALKLITELDSPETLFYLDPPYVFSTRTSSNAYSHEMTNNDHREFAELLHKLKGFIVLSGYPSKIYEELFESRGWQRTDRLAAVMGGAKKTESLWLSPRTVKALGL